MIFIVGVVCFFLGAGMAYLTVAITSLDEPRVHEVDKQTLREWLDK